MVPVHRDEHLLLGLMREDKALANRFLRSHGSIESIRKEIEQRITISRAHFHIRGSPAQPGIQAHPEFRHGEAERLGHRTLGTDICFSESLRERNRFGAEILQERGLRLSTLREELARSAGEKAPAARPKETSLPRGIQSRPDASWRWKGQLDPPRRPRNANSSASSDPVPPHKTIPC